VYKLFVRIREKPQYVSKIEVMKEIGVIGFYGYSNSGKTTLIESLCRDLRERGVRLAVIKQTDQEIRMDQPGKDTYRFQEAGAEVVVLAIVESANDPHIPKIRLGEIEERPNTIWTYDGDYEKLLELIYQP
jgi:Ni2+-binding GTPase involved in maturation of urease and hydrogenase